MRRVSRCREKTLEKSGSNLRARTFPGFFHDIRLLGILICLDTLLMSILPGMLDFKRDHAAHQPYTLNGAVQVWFNQPQLLKSNTVFEKKIIVIHLENFFVHREKEEKKKLPNFKQCVALQKSPRRRPEV